MEWSSAYTDGQWINAVNLSALLGWAAIAIPLSIGTGISVLPYIALFGLPVAFTIAWVLVAPCLRYCMRKSITWGAAIGWGAFIATGLSLIYVVITRYAGWRQSRDPGVHSQIGGGDHIISIDGILTPYGWQQLTLKLMTFILLGASIALIIRWIIGPGRPANKPTTSA